MVVFCSTIGTLRKTSVGEIRGAKTKNDTIYLPASEETPFNENLFKNRGRTSLLYEGFHVAPLLNESIEFLQAPVMKDELNKGRDQLMQTYANIIFA